MDEQYKILVVDDEEVLRLGCSRVLVSEGYRVTTAANGQEALDQLAAEPVNVVLCDLKMPVMGALEVLEQTSVRYPGHPGDHHDRAGHRDRRGGVHEKGGL